MTKKKVFIVLGAVLLLAAACSKSNNQNQSGASLTNVTLSQQQSGASSTPSQIKTYGLTEVQAANSEAKCWTIIDGKVYDVTGWINKHPGGSKAILGLCGKDGTSAFKKQHASQPKPNSELTNYLIGTLK